MSPADRAAAPRLPAPVGALVSRLPQFPHSLGLAIALNLLLRPKLAQESENELRGRVIAIEIEDAGIDLRVRLGSMGFVPQSSGVPAEVTFRATAHDYYLMARRIEDPDTLFFNRRLRIEGNTELGLIVKNSLDAIDWQGLPAPLRRLLDRAAAFLNAAGGQDIPG